MSGPALIHSVGSKVWIKDPVESWVKAEVVQLDGDQLTVKVEETGDTRKCAAEDCPLQNLDARGVEVRTTSVCSFSFASHGYPPHQLATRFNSCKQAVTTRSRHEMQPTALACRTSTYTTVSGLRHGPVRQCAASHVRDAAAAYCSRQHVQGCEQTHCSASWPAAMQHLGHCSSSTTIPAQLQPPFVSGADVWNASPSWPAGYDPAVLPA